MPGIETAGEFLRHAVLDTVVPHATELDIEKAITSCLETDADDLPTILSSIKQRSLLFFDEFLPVRVVLRLSNCSEESLKFNLQRLKARVEVFAIDPAEPPPENAPPTRDLIFSQVLSGSDDPLVVVNAFEDGERSGNHVYVIWNVEAFLRRPRIRIQNPSLLFQSSVNLNPPEKLRDESENDDYLPPLIPASANILQALSANQGSSQTDPFLPASRLLRVIPATYTEEPVHNIKQHPGHPIRVVPAASARIRYSRLNSFSGRPTTVASLDFEVTPFLNCDVLFDKADLQLSDGTIETLSEVPELTPPILCRPRDDITLVYKLMPEYGPDPNPSTTVMASTLDISLGATIKLSEDCNPRIFMQWRTTVDFSVALNPTFGGPSQALQRNNRPASLPMASHQANSASGVPQSNRSSLRERAYSTTDSGVTISFSGPVNVEVGKPFSWDVFIVNRSTIPRKFAMVAMPRRKRIDPRTHVARPSTSSISSFRGDEVAEAVTDDNIIHAMQKNAAGQDAEIISLNTDIRVGPLLPGTCHSFELKLLPLMIGSLHLEAVRLVDVTTNETTDIRDLPDIVAIDDRGSLFGSHE
ncbi:hypothetical protein ASPZODRAFT_58307 [Penicilliopsis zonata CBS 506.65]|uniref:Trafficking protein particle complex II-specific subunit 65 IgD3 domain-containing protein n=1 Tax=Penicilliopsis zonata CBS 506.65 TaxID=1073090 RepID=A0A1L9SR24_9EURO|nr:hypothetical protein ASPZODRAFT_58307 [Penicilliopsis zonata CBS 506.65]OJJ49670.1 hypothetical protein ASPZODRAFT_58307 [Penicilliopsis zonata CBS 506.65]